MAKPRPTLPETVNGEAVEARPVPLSALRRGEQATVRYREMCGEDCELLSAMGLPDRCRLRVCQAGRTCIVQVAATRLGLSRAVAESIFVVPTIGRTDRNGVAT